MGTTARSSRRYRAGCSCFSYGQTGSGKTFTMEGHHDEAGGFSWENDPKAGVIPRTLHHIFSQLEAEKPEDYSVRASYVELYNEQLFDLLNTSTQPLRVYDNKDNVSIIRVAYSCLGGDHIRNGGRPGAKPERGLRPAEEGR